MEHKTLVGTVYTSKHKVYFQTKFFTVAISNSHARDLEDMYEIEDGILYPHANEGKLTAETLLQTQEDKLTELQDAKIELFTSQMKDTVYVKSRTTNLPYPPYHITVNNQVYKVNRVRKKVETDEFLDITANFEDKYLVTNLTTGLTQLKTTDEIKNKTEMVLPLTI